MFVLYNIQPKTIFYFQCALSIYHCAVCADLNDGQMNIWWFTSQANTSKMLVNNGEMLVNDGEMRVWSLVIIEKLH